MKFFTYGNFCAAKKARIISWLKGLDPAIKRMIIMRINLIAFFISITIMNVCASVHAQSLNLTFKEAAITEVLAAIKKQSGYQFLYNETEIKRAKRVSIVLKNAALKEALDQVFKDQPLNYQILDKTIVVKEKAEKPTEQKRNANDLINISGKVTDEKNRSMSGVNIAVKGTDINAVTNSNGEYSLKAADNAILLFSFVGYEPQEVTVQSRSIINIVMQESTGQLDQVQVIGYGTTTRRLSTGAVVKVTSAELSQQNVGNPLQALAGRVPGMYIQSNSGMSGSNMNIQVRGLNSISAGNSPLYIVDGVPFGSASLDVVTISTNTNIVGGISPFNSINPGDIESIEILKDADATAIYGSRGANGVVLITTKKGATGKAVLSVNINRGFAQVPHFVKMLGTQDYIDLRSSAFANDKITPTTANAPDLISWDKSVNTDWQKEIIGGTADVTDIQTSLSGGNEQTKFIISGNYRNEGSVLPGPVRDRKGWARFGVNHNSADNKLSLNVSASYSSDLNKLVTDPTTYINLPPNYPIYDTNENIIYRPGQSTEPYSLLLTPFENKTNTLFGTGNIQYTVFKNLNIKANLGYTRMDLDQLRKVPVSAQNVAIASTGYSYFGNSRIGTWNIEPQIDYNKEFKFGKVDLLLGTAFQQTDKKSQLINAGEYTSDGMLDNIAAAGSISFVNNAESRYRYTSIFGRANYNYRNKYILNATFRRDGSSRFGPNRQFGNFGSIGAAWIFTEEQFVKDNFSFLSYGKFRASYGITGNDQISDYQYVPTYVTTTYGYQIPGLRPSRIANPDYSWETNRKMELATDLGFLKDRLLLGASFYRNRSGNMLVSYPLAGQAGFTSYQANMPAIVQNTGWEFTITSTPLKTANFEWMLTANLTLPRNKLIDFPNIEQTPYASNNLLIGQPITLAWGYRYLGVDPQTGLAKVEDVDGNNLISFLGDFVPIGNTMPKSYGGLNSSVRYRDLQLDFQFQFAKKIGLTPLRAWSTGTIPGNIKNIPLALADIWKQTDDNVLLPKATTSSGTYYYTQSDAGSYEDASYIKLKSINLSYSFKPAFLQKIGLRSLQLSLQAQNLFTITKYSGFDPESVSPAVLPNLRVFMTSVQCKF